MNNLLVLSSSVRERERERERERGEREREAAVRRMVEVFKERFQYLLIYSEPCLKRPLKYRQNKDLDDKW